ncbi:unnamed protein product [Periconia digitata]|uniref:Myb-like domain-containing protein n=1 Tax=Periconia digitata TaxID=1303443 RepID=A0A9W4XHM7_9PLEO|nr:unnamed protein product [Periconia digitata]
MPKVQKVQWWMKEGIPRDTGSRAPITPNPDTPCPSTGSDIALAVEQSGSPPDMQLSTPMVENHAPNSCANSMNDSGYLSPAHTPRAQKRALFSTRDLIVYNKPISEQLKDRFLDIKILYTQSLWEAISSKRKGDPGDISMKLKYMGESEPTARLYIVIQCERRISRRVNKFFAQEHVAEELNPDFRVHVIPTGPLRLTSCEKLEVLGNIADSRSTLCGMPIEIGGERAPRIATLGGLIMVTAQEKTVYGLTAGHSLVNFVNDSSNRDSNREDINSGCDDEDTDAGYESAQQSSPNQEHSCVSTSRLPCSMDNIGRVVANSFQSTENTCNHDWALVALDREDWAPNYLVNRPTLVVDASESNKTTNKGGTREELDSNLHLIPFSYGPRLRMVEQPVAAITSRGLQHGILTSNGSSLTMFPGGKFLETFDFLPFSGSTFLPGDSGSWVVNKTTGEVYGHVVSIDTFGEASVIPMQSTLLDIKFHLRAYEVRFPSKEEISALQTAQKNDHDGNESATSSRRRTWNVNNDKFNNNKRSKKNTRVSLGKRKANDFGGRDNPKKPRDNIERKISGETTRNLRSSLAKTSPADLVPVEPIVTDGEIRTSSWSTKDDEILIQARAQGLNWNQIAPKHFPSKSPNSCRKRHERLMQKQNVEQWDGPKLGILATVYMEHRAEIWGPIANLLGEKWTVVEQKCMEKGLKNLSQAYRAEKRKGNDSGISISDDDYPINQPNMYLSCSAGVNRDNRIHSILELPLMSYSA